MSWDLQDIGAHLVEKHDDQYQDLPRTFIAREFLHDQDHAHSALMGHVHDPNDPRIIKEDDK